MSRYTFQKRHFEAIARVMRDLKSRGFPNMDAIVNVFSKMFKESNPNFDPIAFRRACGVEGHTK